MPVQIRNLSKAFGEKQVLCHFSMVLEDHERYCLMGPSGAGKTTLLRLLMGLERPDGGQITGLPEDGVCAMFQEDRLLPSLSALQNVALVCPKSLSRQALREDLSAMLPQDCLQLPIAQLSGGMKRRVALARALHYSGSLVLLDEPFTGLDEESKRAAAGYIRGHLAGRTLVVSTHGQEDACLLGAQVIHINFSASSDRSAAPADRTSPDK